MACQKFDLPRRELLADGEHATGRVATPLAGPPCRELRRDIGGRLPGERRIAGPYAFAIDAMALRASRLEQPGGLRKPFRRWLQCRIIAGDQRPIIAAQPSDDGAHRGVFAATAGIIVQLAAKIARVEARQPWCEATVTFAGEAVTGGAGIAGSAIATAKGDDLAAGPKGGIAAGSITAR